MKAPKKPLSAFMIFSIEKRQDVAQEHPEFRANDILKTIALMWKNMSDDEKHVYNQLQKEGRQAYEQEIAVYNQKNMNANIRATNNQRGNDDDSDDYDAC
ncbi:hypothetical protein SteCoe_20994 [Stentor coeruleus]|uniref:HMG box domain-containing protein n=1 Tax=Stentor coeruleus TaxID=5963 RepID=A0A1R2BQD8_9CILI|nr:hypothetical protein SteCoe_20994 [Stentor coeruleus]